MMETYTQYYFFPFGGFLALGWMMSALVYFIAFVLPFVLIIRKAGYSPLWVIVGFVPVLNFIFLWIFALSRWPVERGDV